MKHAAKILSIALAVLATRSDYCALAAPAKDGQQANKVHNQPRDNKNFQEIVQLMNSKFSNCDVEKFSGNATKLVCTKNGKHVALDSKSGVPEQATWCTKDRDNKKNRYDCKNFELSGTKTENASAKQDVPDEIARCKEVNGNQNDYYACKIYKLSTDEQIASLKKLLEKEQRKTVQYISAEEGGNGADQGSNKKQKSNTKAKNNGNNNNKKKPNSNKTYRNIASVMKKNFDRCSVKAHRNPRKKRLVCVKNGGKRRAALVTSRNGNGVDKVNLCDVGRGRGCKSLSLKTKKQIKHAESVLANA